MTSWFSGCTECACVSGNQDVDVVNSESGEQYDQVQAKTDDASPSLVSVVQVGETNDSPFFPGTPATQAGGSTSNLESSASAASVSSATPVHLGGQTPSSLKTNVSFTLLADLPEDIVKTLEEADKLRTTGFVFKAEQQVLELVNQLTADDKLDILEKVKNTKEYTALTSNLEEVNCALTKLLDDQGWTLQKEADKILVWTKPEPNSDLMTVRLAGLIDGPFDSFCSIGKEVDHIKTWMPGVRQSNIVKQLNTFDHIGFYVWKFPFITAREFLVEEANMINDEMGYCITCRQPPMERAGVNLPACQKGSIRAAISNWCSFSAPCGDKKIFTVTVMNVDLKIPLPTRLTNYLSVSMGYQSFKDLRANVLKAENPKSELGICVNDPKNTVFYSRMRGLETARNEKEIACREEILRSGWVKNPEDRKKIFNRGSGDVLVPMK